MSTICMTGPDLKIIATEGKAQAKVADTLGGMDHVPHSIKSKINHLHELANESMCSSVIKLTMIKLINFLNDSSNHVIEKNRFVISQSHLLTIAARAQSHKCASYDVENVLDNATKDNTRNREN